jgi:hypothetical protein
MKATIFLLAVGWKNTAITHCTTTFISFARNVTIETKQKSERVKHCTITVGNEHLSLPRKKLSRWRKEEHDTCFCWATREHTLSPFLRKKNQEFSFSFSFHFVPAATFFLVFYLVLICLSFSLRQSH